MIPLPADNPAATLAAAREVCAEASRQLEPEIAQRFPQLTKRRDWQGIMQANEGTFTKGGHTVFITTGIRHQGTLPETGEMADFCAAAVTRVAAARFPVPVARPEDLTDAKAAFARMLAYQKSDDPETPELYTKDCFVSITLTDGKDARLIVLHGDGFRRFLTQELALKTGNKDTYEEPTYTQEGTGVRLVVNLVFAESGKRGSVSLLYQRKGDGLRIAEQRVVQPVNTLPR